ncbi:hypothetical protein J2S08_003432 [Bacillus chungangensis]|uniref:Uncharacterized protein n=1 Tax=Bacillus chungangensis TaxID=587633 RepID=A0ABT9WWG3_9BACI|nr:hypothetical protein [Bacillus chungangensis]
MNRQKQRIHVLHSSIIFLVRPLVVTEGSFQFAMYICFLFKGDSFRKTRTMYALTRLNIHQNAI